MHVLVKEIKFHMEKKIKKLKILYNIVRSKLINLNF